MARRASTSAAAGWWFHVASITVGLLVAALVFYPLARMLLRLFVVDGVPTVQPVQDMLVQADLLRVLVNTVVLVVSAGGLGVAFGAVLAWLNERTDARIGLLTDVLPLVPFLMPVIAGAIGWILLLSPRAGLLNAAIRSLLSFVGIRIDDGPFNIFTWWGLIFVTFLYLVPYSFLVVSAALRNLDASLEEQSLVCGAGLFRTMLRVTLPALRPSLAAGALIVAAIGFAMISVPIIIGTGARIDVVAVRIVRLLTFTYPPRMGAAVSMSIFVLVVLVILWLIQGRINRSGLFASIGGRGVRSMRLELGRWKWPARSLMGLYILASVVLPVGALLIVTLNGFWTTSIRWGSLNLDALRLVIFENPATRSAIVNSVLLGVAAATVGMMLASIVALYVRRSRGALARAIDGSMKLPAAISNLVLAVGFILAFSGSPFNLGGTLTILFLAYVVVHMPPGSIAADAAASQVGKELEEASSISGARGWRTFRKVSLPVMMPGLAAGWALLFVRNAGDINASAILGGTRNPVVGFRILELYENGSMALLAALSMALTLVSFLVIVLLLVLTRRPLGRQPKNWPRRRPSVQSGAAVVRPVENSVA